MEAFPDGSALQEGIYSVGYLWEGYMPMYRNKEYLCGLKVHLA